MYLNKGDNMNKIQESTMDQITLRRVWNQLIINTLVYQAVIDFSSYDGIDFEEHYQLMVCSNVKDEISKHFNCQQVAPSKRVMPCNNCRMMWEEPDTQIFY